MWSCPKCKREFSKNNQSHSCVVYPLANHFKDKPFGEGLFKELVKKLDSIKFIIDSVPCCIHLVSKSTFCAAWIGKNKMKIDFKLDTVLKNKRFSKVLKMSANRYLYYMEIKTKEEIDKELISWIKKSHELTNT